SANGGEVCTNHAADVRFWQRQCAASRREGNREHGVTADSLRALLDCVALFSRPFGGAGCLTAGCDLLTPRRHLSDRDEAARALLALELDRCAGLVCDAAVVECGGAHNRHGDDDDDAFGPATVRSHHRGPALPTVGDVIAMLDSSLCRVSDEDSLDLFTRLANCALRSARHSSRDGDDDDDALAPAGDDGAA